MTNSSWRFYLHSYLYVFYPVLQEDLHATSHSTEELIEKRQILNSVLIQQVSQTWKFPTRKIRNQAAFKLSRARLWFKNMFLLRKVPINMSCVPFCRVVVRCSPSNCFSTLAMSGFLNREKNQLMLQMNLCVCETVHWILQCRTHCVLWSKYVMTLSASSSRRLLTWWR